MTDTEPAGLARLGPLTRSGPLRQLVKDALIELIINRQLAPGQHLVEVEIAEQLDVSRQPVREALQALHTDGWVDLHPGRGAFVHVPDDAEVMEVFSMRILLESEAARLAARAATAKPLAELRVVCGDGRQAAQSGDTRTAVALNANFHRTIAAMSGNRMLAGFIEAMDRRVRWYFSPIAERRRTDSWDEHEGIIEALAAKDARLAARLMRAHIARSRDTHLSMT